MVDEQSNGDGGDSPKNGNGEDTTEELTITSIGELEKVYGPNDEEWVSPLNR